MPSFLYTATNREQQNITSRVEADNMSQARLLLESKGFSEITFYDSELSDDVRKLFGDRGEKNKNVFLKQRVEAWYDSRLSTYFLNLLKIWILPIAVALFLIARKPSFLSFGVLGVIIFAYFYLAVPSVLFRLLHAAHAWNKNRKVRVLATLFKIFNKLTMNKMPESEIDVYLGCADARDGYLEDALSRIEKYKNDPKISRRLYNRMQIRIFDNARRYDKVLEYIENSVTEVQVGADELIGYAVCLARRHKRTSQAREVLQTAMEQELNPLANIWIPYCQAIIEVEEDNHTQAEFYLKRASKELEPFRHNSRLVGIRSEIKAFSAIVQAKLGYHAEASRSLDECKTYLTAIQETELLQRCVEAIG